jgi:hypothetical protein
VNHYIVFTECLDNSGNVLGGGYMHIDAPTPQDAADKAVRVERESWGSPRLNVRTEVVVED